MRQASISGQADRHAISLHHSHHRPGRHRVAERPPRIPNAHGSGQSTVERDAADVFFQLRHQRQAALKCRALPPKETVYHMFLSASSLTRSNFPSRSAAIQRLTASMAASLSPSPASMIASLYQRSARIG